MTRESGLRMGITWLKLPAAYLYTFKLRIIMVNSGLLDNIKYVYSLYSSIGVFVKQTTNS